MSNALTQFCSTLFFVAAIIILPPLALGTIQKTKARLQNRRGAPVLQPFYELLRLMQKDEIISQTSSWLFRLAAALNCSVTIYLTAVVPWLSPYPVWSGIDVFTFIYALAAIKLFTLLAAMDAGSMFGAFAASREATLSFLVEPVAILSLVALSISAGSTQLHTIFAVHSAAIHPGLWILTGAALLLASTVELSRMPVDDPTTHLELTMVHEAMLLEASGRNLALFQYSHMLRLCLLFGLSSQCFLQLLPAMPPPARMISGIAGLLGVCVMVGIFESVSVKLNWRKTPEFIAYGITLAAIACIMAIGTAKL